MAVKQYRTFATTIYPESMPENIWSILSDLHIPMAVSPCHDSDVNEDTGELKKPHFHVMLCFDGKKSESAVRDICQSFGGVGLEIIQDKRAYGRYLCHLDDTEKARYSVDDIRYFGGLVLDLSADGIAGVGENVSSLVSYIHDSSIGSFRELVLSLVESKNYRLLQYVQNNAYFVRQFL